MGREKRNQKENKKIVIAMSGGVDSSVAAALLKRNGFDPYTKRAHAPQFGAKGTSARYGVGVDVVGVFMKFWSEPEKDGLIGVSNRCCSPEAENRARKVAKILKIPFYVFNFEKEFKKRIVDYFLEGYKKGITPNPCVVCNKEIKFGLLLEKALKLNADFVATGHYSRTNLYKNLTIVRNLPKVRLMRAKDKEKDQGYFLWQLNQKQLRRILFPIGDYTRKEVENLAKKFKLPVLKAKKSVEICFVQTTIHPVKSRKAGSPEAKFNGVNDFLKRYLKKNPGDIVNTEGKIIGKHAGLWFYTIGQRKGMGLAGGPYWVLDKNVKKNLLIVTKNEKDLYKKELVCKNVNWVAGKKPKLPLKVKVKIRYRSAATEATIFEVKSTIYNLKFKIPQRAITPGQSVVFYKDQELLGGGIIC